MGTLKPGVPLMYERVDGVVYGRYQGTTDRFKIGEEMRPISPNDIKPEPHRVGWDSTAGHGHNQYTKEEIEDLEGLDITSAISLLQTARQDIIELKSKVNSLELTSFLILE